MWALCRHRRQSKQGTKEILPWRSVYTGEVEKKLTIRSALEEVDILIVGAEDHRGEEREGVSAKGKG